MDTWVNGFEAEERVWDINLEVMTWKLCILVFFDYVAAVRISSYL